MSQKEFQDVSIIVEDFNNSSFKPITLLHNYLIKQLRNQNKSYKIYSEHFNLINTLQSEICDPYDVKTNYKFIFIASSSTNCINVFHRKSKEHFYDLKISKLNCTTIGLDPNNENDLYIAGLNHNYIYHYRYVNTSFEFVKKIEGEFTWIVDMTIDRNCLYCVDNSENKIFILNKENGQLIREIANEFTFNPLAITLFDKYSFFLATNGSKSIVKLSLIDGKLLNSLGEGIRFPAGMVYNDETNHLLVCDYNKSKLYVIDCKIFEIVREVDCKFNGIFGIDIDCEGNLYICENHTHTIKIFN